MMVVSARLALSQVLVSPGEEITHVVINDSDNQLEFGLEYGLQQNTPQGWQRVPVTEVFSAAALGVGPRQTSREMTATIPRSASPGAYRLSKTLYIIGADGIPVPGEHPIYAEFTVQT